jgi:hypothetical protein
VGITLGQPPGAVGWNTPIKNNPNNFGQLPGSPRVPVIPDHLLA